MCDSNSHRLLHTCFQEGIHPDDARTRDTVDQLACGMT